jgi:hypothetical protein
MRSCSVEKAQHTSLEKNFQKNAAMQQKSLAQQVSLPIIASCCTAT